jgi:monooxygenase
MAIEHVDVLIVGAGLSGIGAAYHLQKQCPNKKVVIVERRQAIGGTWDLFRYPGIRSDSDMFTLGYNFKPWTNPKAIADGTSIREYVQETARENGIDKKIRFGLQVRNAAWSSANATWTVDAVREATGEAVQFTCRFLLMCSGYYNYDSGYTPEFKGIENYQGQVVHPQKWTEDIDYTNKNVVVIGSGATAVTLVPSMADKAAHVTMLQRSPTYVISVPERDIISDKLRPFLPEKMVYRLARTRNVGLQMMFYRLSKNKPEVAKRFLLQMVRRQLGKNADMSHFTPKYNPWDERVCAVPDGDLFKVIRQGKASVVTDHIDTFTKTGIRLKSGQELQADMIITATGLNLQLLGGMKVQVDGKPFEMTETLNYRGVMFKDLPNLAMIFGYTNASWTLKADLSSEYICRLLKHMDKHGLRQCTPRNYDDSVVDEPFLGLASGYIQRAKNVLPKQGNKAPWKLYQNYALDLANLRFSKLEDGAMTFSNPK